MSPTKPNCLAPPALPPLPSLWYWGRVRAVGRRPPLPGGCGGVLSCFQVHAKIAILDPTKLNAGSAAGWLSPVGWGLVALLACVASFHGLSCETEWNPRSGSRRFCAMLFNMVGKGR